MKIQQLFSLLQIMILFQNSQESSSDKTPTLFQMKGYEIPAEFSDEKTKNEVQNDIKNFDSLDEYKPKKFSELDHGSKNVERQITQEIFERSKDNSHSDFFQLSDTVTQSEEFKKGYVINFGEFFNNKTGKYERKFKNAEIADAMKNMHINYFNEQVDSAKKQQSFIQKEASNYLKRPSGLVDDVESTFLEVQEMEKAQWIYYQWEYLNTYNCWASSRWEFAFLFICWSWVWSTIYIAWIFPYSYLRPYANICIWIWFLSYPCSTQIGGRGYNWFWLSEKLSEEGKMKEITFRVEFDVTRRVMYHSFLFMATPDAVKIEMSQDLNTYEVAVDYQKAPDQGWWWWWWWYYQYFYPPLTFAKGVKIVLQGLRKNYMGNRHGLWWVDFYSQTQTVMILEKSSTGIPRCLARAEVGYYQTEKPMILMNALDAIIQNDSREIFYLDKLFVRQWYDQMCVTGGKFNKENPHITAQWCQNSDKHMFVIDRLGKFMNKEKPTQCLAAKEDDAITQVQTYGSVKVSGTISDSRANPYNIIDPNQAGWWAAPLDMKTALWEIMFDRQYLVEEITIQFKFVPKKVAINVFSRNGRWLTVYSQKPDGGDVSLMITPAQISGVQVHFLELDYDKPTEFKKPAYGIKKIFIKRPGVALSMQTCSFQGKESKLVNRFKLDLVEFIDSTWLVPQYAAISFMHITYETTKIIVETFVVQITKYSLVVKNAELILAQIRKINVQIDVIYKLLGPYKNYVKTEGSPAGGKCYACSPETSALNCHYIKKKAPLRLNGYFWIKTKCMPSAERVYCDFTTGDGNFYIYYGNLRDKAAAIDANKIEKLQDICKKNGLENVEIASDQQVKSIMGYLNQIGANSEDNIGIPFGYQYDSKFIGDKFQSLNNKNSKENTKFLMKFMETQNLMDKLTTIGANIMILKNSKDKLFKGFISNAKIRGVVCSENKDLKTMLAGQMKGSCQATLQSIGTSKVNTILKLTCPGDCAKAQQYKVFGGKPSYSEFSSICRAAVHSGAINDMEGGPIEVKVVQGSQNYLSSSSNEVTSFEAAGSSTDRAFVVVKKPVEAACPNLKPKKKSFISFNEIIDKVKTKKQASFIESKENSNNKNSLEHKSTALENLEDPPTDPQAGSGEPAMTMEKAIGYVNKQLKNNFNMIAKYAAFIKDTEIIFKQYELILASIYGSDLNPTVQQTLLSTTFLRITATKLMIQELVQAGQAKLAKYLELYLKRLDDLFFLQRYQPHKETYELDWQSTYTVMDSSMTKNGPSQWKFTKEDVFPHRQAIAQLRDISCGQDFQSPTGECTATIQNLKYKQFYDFKLTLDFKVRKQGFLGVIFRQKDQYNYYSLEFQNEHVQFRRMKEGQQKIVATAQIDKLLSDTWYNLQLTVSETVFKAKLGKETDPMNPKKYDNIKDIIVGEDQHFKTGFQSLFSDATLGFFIDNYKVDHLDCWRDPFDEAKAIKYKQPQASRFYEIYRSDINQIWIQNPKETILWMYIANAWSRKKAIKKVMTQTQESRSPIIMGKYQLNKGWCGFDVYRETKTTEFSFVFFYVNDKNYMEFVIMNKRVIIREVENGKKSQIASQVREDIRTKTWYTFYIQITDVIEIYFEESLMIYNSRIRLQVFDKTIERPRPGGFLLGFNVNKGTAAIDQIKLLPGKIPPPGKPDTDDNDGDDGDNGDNGDNGDIKDDDDDNDIPGGKKDCNLDNSCQKKNFDYKVCIDSTKSSQIKWCELATGGLKAPMMNCQSNFCEMCCEKQVPGKKTNIMQQCVTECAPVNVEKDSTYEQCYNSKDPKHSAQLICAIQFPAKHEKQQATNCKVDLCDMCCNMTPLMIEKGMTKQDMDQCFKGCHSRFDI